jgi:D-tyrosyl-tRNA(Tyr) deacylase
MRAVIQRVKESWVDVDGERIAQIGAGLNILLGVVEGDTESDAKKLAQKIARLRIFADERGRFDRSLVDIGGEALVVSQFTLAASIRRGRRPDFAAAMEPAEAKRLYELFCDFLGELVPVQKGRFGAMMEVGIINEGPVTIIADSKEL